SSMLATRWFTGWFGSFRASLGLKMTRRRRRYCDYGPVIEALESRQLLSASAVTVDLSAAAAPTNSGADYIYSRKGNKQDAGAMRGLGGVALEGGGTDVSAAFRWMIGRMGGEGDFLVIRATKDAKYDPYVFKLGGTNSVATLDIPSRAAAL